MEGRDESSNSRHGFRNLHCQRVSNTTFPGTAGKPVLRQILQQRLEWANMFVIKNKAQSKNDEFPVMGGRQSETRYPLTGDGGGVLQ